MCKPTKMWWVLADVCRALDIANHRDCAARLDDDEKGVDTIDTPGGAQQMVIITEPGLYAVIQQSRKPRRSSERTQSIAGVAKYT